MTVAVEGVTDEVTVDQESLTFTPQTWSDPQTVVVSVAEDPDAVEDAAVTLTHTAMGGDYTGLAVESVTVRSIENDTATLSLADAAARENESAVTFTATLSVATSDTVTVSYATSDGTATAGADYTAGSGTLTFRPDEALTQTISVPILPDDLDEANETFTVTLSDPVNAALGDGEATGTITDDDDAPELTLSAPADAVAESAGSLGFTVRLDAASGPRGDGVLRDVGRHGDRAGRLSGDERDADVRGGGDGADGAGADHRRRSG